MNKRAGALPDRQRRVVDIFTEKPEKIQMKESDTIFFFLSQILFTFIILKLDKKRKKMTSFCSILYLPASSEIPTRQGLLADITSAQIFSKSKGVDKHSSPPK